MILFMISFCLFTIVNFLRLNNNICSKSNEQKPYSHSCSLFFSDDTIASQVDITVSDIIVRQSLFDNANQ